MSAASQQPKNTRKDEPKQNLFDTVKADDLKILLPVLKKLSDYDKGINSRNGQLSKP